MPRLMRVILWMLRRVDNTVIVGLGEVLTQTVTHSCLFLLRVYKRKPNLPVGLEQYFLFFPPKNNTHFRKIKYE